MLEVPFDSKVLSKGRGVSGSLSTNVALAFPALFLDKIERRRLEHRPFQISLV